MEEVGDSGVGASTALDRRRHLARTGWLLAETAGVAVGLAAVTLWLGARPEAWAVVPWLVAVALQGCWLHRIYVVGHEATHRKLVPGALRLNDLLGQLVLLPLLVPLRIYRKIHAYHHGANRADAHTSALDTFVVRGPVGPVRRAALHAVWYLAVFGGGFFLHSLVSVVLFLCLPLSMARRVSPAFRGWRLRDQVASAAAFLGGVGVHLALALALGPWGWAQVIGLPFLVFALVYSVLVYIYHYRTSYGAPVALNVRSLRRDPVSSWWLLNFNEHATHHAHPTLPWYLLPERRVELPPSHAANQRVHTIGAAIGALLQGPVIVEEG